MALVPVLMTGVSAAILGDQVAYGLGRWGGRPLVDRMARRLGGAPGIRKAEELSRRWGATGIFFSRWLVTEACPWVSMTSGLARYSYRRFVLLAVTGEALWVGLYVTIGYAYSLKVQYVAELLDYHGRLVLVLILALAVGWSLLRRFRKALEKNRADRPSG